MTLSSGAFFYVRSSEGRQGLAEPEGRTRQDDEEIIERTMFGGLIEEWPERRYRIDGEFADLQPEIRALKLCSPELRRVLDSHRSPADSLQWLPATVESMSGEQRPYWVLHFPEFPDVLDVEKSTFEEYEGERFYDSAVLDLRKAARHSVMPSPERFATAFMIAEPVMRALVEAGLSGLTFDRARTA